MRKSILKLARALFFHNFGWKVLSVAIALVIWALVASEPELSTFANVRLEYKNLPDDLEIGSEPVGAISLELRGPSGELRDSGEGGVHPAVILDMSGVPAGERTFPIGGSNVKLARGVRLVRAIPSEVHFRFEPRLQRNVPVLVRISGDGQNGYVVARKEATPSELTVVGPRSNVLRVAGVTTDSVDVAGVVGSSEFRVNAFVEDPYVRLQSSPLVSVRVTMKKK